MTSGSDLRCFDHDVLAFRQGIPDAVVEQIRFLVEERPRQSHFVVMRAAYRVDELRGFDLQRPNDVRRDWSHIRIVVKNLELSNASPS